MKGARKRVFLPAGCWGPGYDHGAQRYFVELTSKEVETFKAELLGGKTPLDYDEEVALWNALCVADRYTAKLPDTSAVKKKVAAGVKVALKRGFPFIDDKGHKK